MKYNSSFNPEDIHGSTIKAQSAKEKIHMFLLIFTPLRRPRCWVSPAVLCHRQPFCGGAWQWPRVDLWRHVSVFFGILPNMQQVFGMTSPKSHTPWLSYLHVDICPLVKAILSLPSPPKLNLSQAFLSLALVQWLIE